MYDIKSGLHIGFHGCDIKTRDNLIINPNEIEISKSDYDWLGHGFYVWENSFDRAVEFAEEKKSRRKIETPSVVGVIYDLGYCLDFTDLKYTKLIADVYGAYIEELKTLNISSVPKNKKGKSSSNEDYLLRYLDCAVIEYMHSILDKNQTGFDSVKGMFHEGEPAYPGAGILLKTHVQICIRNLNCIKGFFKPRI